MQGLPKLQDRIVQLSIHGQPQAKGIVSVGVISLGLQRRCAWVVGVRIVCIKADQCVAQVVKRIFVAGSDLKGFEVIIYCFVRPPFVIQSMAEAVERDEIVVRQGDGVAEK